jgi:hypothetical protein
MGLFSALFRVKEMNADPDQQALAQLFIDVVERRKTWAAITFFLTKGEWSRSEQRNRVAHSISMVRVWRADLYPKAKELGELIYTSI